MCWDNILADDERHSNSTIRKEKQNRRIDCFGPTATYCASSHLRMEYFGWYKMYDCIIVCILNLWNI